MAKFNEGDKVVCIDSFDTMNKLTVDKVYTVLSARFGDDNRRTIWICDDKGNIDFYVNWRFVSLIDKRCKTIDGILDYADI